MNPAPARSIQALAATASAAKRQLIAATAAGLFLLEIEDLALNNVALFKRADSDGSGAVDLSDAVHTLEFLFLGVGELPCPDAAGVNDDGKVDVTDPIASLIWLFIDPANPPAAPGPDSCGPDPTPGAEPLPACHTICG